MCVCVCVKEICLCENPDHMPKSRSEGDREGKGLCFYLSFMCVFLYFKSWTMLMLEEMCNLRKDGVRKKHHEQCTIPRAAKQLPDRARRGEAGGYREAGW